MKSKPVQPVSKTECCRRFGWTRYQFDLHVTAGMPVVEAAGHKGAEWRIDPAAVRRWLAERAAEQAARRRRVAAYHEERRREAERAAEALRARERQRERARREAERRREAEWLEREAGRKTERWLARAYRHCKRRG